MWSNMNEENNQFNWVLLRSAKHSEVATYDRWRDRGYIIIDEIISDTPIKLQREVTKDESAPRETSKKGNSRKQKN